MIRCKRRRIHIHVAGIAVVVATRRRVPVDKVMGPYGLKDMYMSLLISHQTGDQLTMFPSQTTESTKFAKFDIDTQNI
jgi:hypothetical protein